nr:NAD(P)-binding domain-containing protein [uncultured Devosia sp.]
MTTIAIIGLGNMGKGLAKRLAGKTDLVLSSRDQAAVTAFAATLPAGVTVLGQDAAIAKADVVVLAMPYAKALEVAANPALSGKVVLDMSNPITPDFSGLLFGYSTSAAEHVQQAAPGARVVKGYNTIFSSLFDLPAAQTASIPVFLAGSDEAAVAAVENLVKLSGFAVEKTGGIEAARLLEPLGMLNIRLGYGLGHGTDIAPTWAKLAA